MSGRIRVTGPWPEDTGRPATDNWNRGFNAHMRRRLPATIRITARSRRRRKQLLRIEGARYLVILRDAILARHPELGAGGPR